MATGGPTSSTRSRCTRACGGRWSGSWQRSTLKGPKCGRNSIREFEIDGAQFSTLAELNALLDAILFDAGIWPVGNHLDGSLNDLAEALKGWLQDDLGTDFWPESFVIRWKNSEVSRKRLGSPVSTVADKKRSLARLTEDPFWAKWWPYREESAALLRKEIRLLKRGVKVDPTVFEMIVGILLEHAPDSSENYSDKGLTLMLE